MRDIACSFGRKWIIGLFGIGRQEQRRLNGSLNMQAGVGVHGDDGHR